MECPNLRESKRDNVRRGQKPKQRCFPLCLCGVCKNNYTIAILWHHCMPRQSRLAHLVRINSFSLLALSKGFLIHVLEGRIGTIFILCCYMQKIASQLYYSN